LTYISQFDLLERVTVKQVRKNEHIVLYRGGVTELLRLGCTRAQGHLGILPRLVWIRGVFGVIWGLFGVIVGVFLEIRECFWTICGVFWMIAILS